MKIIQCDRCKSIITMGRLVTLGSKQFNLEDHSEEHDWNIKNLEICDSCFNNLLMFLGHDPE